MRKLTFAMILSLDGYIATPGDDLGGSVPSDELAHPLRQAEQATAGHAE